MLTIADAGNEPSLLVVALALTHRYGVYMRVQSTRTKCQSFIKFQPSDCAKALILVGWM